MSTPPPDQAARDRITMSGLAETLFVEAGAGSGKTTQLVGRIINLVLDGKVPLAAIAAITFTEAAAAELRTRIRAAFEAAAVEGPPERSELAMAALAEADSAAISTVHGFANRILAERPLAAGLPPRTRVLDEVASRVQMEDRWSAFVEGLHHLAQTDPSIEALLVRTSALGVEFEPRYPGQQTLKTLALAFAQNWDRLDSYRTRQRQPLPPIDWGALEKAVDQALEFDIDARCHDHSDRLYDQLCGTTFPALRAFQDQREPDARLQLLRGSPWKATNGRAPAWPEGAKPEVVALVKAAEAARLELVAQVSHDLLNETIAQVAHNEVSAANARRAAGTLEFHDLLVLARNLLRSDREARQQLGASYRYLLLDEFQDTDPIQIELAVLIAGSIVGAEADEMTDPHWWSTIPVEDGRLFFVGDPKQSIYRFRRADIGLFLRAMQRFGQPDGSDVVRLTTNFRSVAPLLDFVNRLFVDLMVEDGDKQPRYEPLASHRDEAPGADHRPVLLGGPHPDPTVGADTLRELEAADVAAAVAAIRADPERWPVWDRESEQWRPAALADITILIPARTSLPYLRRALDLEAVPYRLATGTLVYDSQEIRDVLSVLRALDDQTDEISLVAALRSPLLGCSDVDLFTFHQAGGRWRFTSTPPEGLPSDHPVLRSFDLLRSLWDQRWWLSPSAMVDQVLQSCAAALVAFGAVRPADVWNRHRFLVDQARLFEESAGGGLREFLRWTELQSAEGSRIHEPILAETDEDTVKVMTVHSAKGLEFPITVLSGTTTIPGNGSRGMSLKWDADGVPALKWTKGVATVGHDALADLEAEMDENEKLRLLYVALTRACDHLVISCHHKASKPTSWSAQVHLAASGHPDLWRQLDLADPGQRNHPRPTESTPADRVTTPGPDTPGHPEGTDEASRDAWRADRAAVIGAQRAARVLSATGVARGMARSGPVEAGTLEAVDEPTQDQLDDDGADSTTVPRRRGRIGNAIGSATHATLQILDLRGPGPIEAQVKRQCEIESIPEHAATVLALVQSALGSDAVQLAARHPHHKELYVIAPIEKRDGTPAIEGYVDLLVDTPDGLVVIDYKTDTVTDDRAIDEKVAAYRWQGAAYAVALEQVTGQPVVECRFVFCRPSGAVERSVVDLRQAMDEVRQFLQPESAANR